MRGAVPYNLEFHANRRNRRNVVGAGTARVAGAGADLRKTGKSADAAGFGLDFDDTGAMVRATRS